jgi:hypothetical protein
MERKMVEIVQPSGTLKVGDVISVDVATAERWIGIGVAKASQRKTATREFTPSKGLVDQGSGEKQPETPGGEEPEGNTPDETPGGEG